MAKSPSRPDPSMIADALAGAEVAPNLVQPGDQQERHHARQPYDVATLPDDCPVRVLGHHKMTNWVLDHAGQLVQMSSKCDKGELMQLFGTRIDWLIDVFPSFGQPKNGEPPPCTGFNQKRVQEALIGKAAKQGIFDPAGRVRGRGAHKGTAGEVYLHCGDKVLVAGVRSQRNPGEIRKSGFKATGPIGRLVFPTEPAIEPPAEVAAPVALGERVLEFLRQFHWKDPYHATLVFAWWAASNMGGALDHRPSLWVTGPSGAGKTTLQQALRILSGDWAKTTEDATEAGLRQLLNQDTLAVMFDEIEPDESNALAHMKIIKLARLAYSGGEALRGSTDHRAHSFTARSCFLFSSIHHHQLPAQDRNRMAIVELRPPPAGSVFQPLPGKASDWGAMLRRRMAEQWHRYVVTLEAYALAMLREGFSGREQNTYATLLACADLLLHDSAPDWAEAEMMGKPCRTVAASLALSAIINRSRGETEDTTTRCLNHLVSVRLPARSGEDQQSVARWISRALISLINSDGRKIAADKLMAHGMKLVHANDSGESAGVEAFDPNRAIHVAIASASHASARELFKGTMWESGIWPQSLTLAPGAIAGRKARWGTSHRCTLVPIEAMIDVEMAQEDARAAMAAGA